MPSSISVALASPSASTKKASLIIGSRIRLTTKPGPLLTVIGDSDRERSSFGVIEPPAIAADRLDIVGIQQLGVQHRKRGAHGLAPPCRMRLARHLRGFPVKAEAARAEYDDVKEPAGHHQVLVEMDHVVLIAGRQMHAKSG